MVVTTFAAQMAVWAGLTVLDIAGVVNPWWLTLSSVLSGAAGALQFPSLQELERQLVPDDRLHEVNGAFASAGAIASVTGALGGGVLLTLTSPAVAFAFNAVSYVPLMVIISRLPMRAPAVSTDHGRPGLRDALSYVWSQHRLRVAIRLGVVLTLIAAPIATLLPAIAEELGSEAHVLGLLTAFYSLGGSLVAVVLTILSRRVDRSRLVRPAVLSCATSLLLIGLLGAALGSPGRQIAIVAMLVPIGLGLAMAQAVISALVQLAATAQLQSQVLALYAAASSILAPVGAITLAVISEARSVWLAVALAGGLLDAIAIISRILIGSISQELQGADHRTTLAHAAHHGRFARGSFDPRRF
ncbi:MAG: MFS transporter, partial [Ilumatobacteraceae bacterium]